jgi:NADPH2:quinone reductase
VRAARVLRHGPPSCVVVQDVPVPVPGPGEVLVRVRAAAVNYPDVLIAAGAYQVVVPAPFTCGSEFAGEVVALGPGATAPPPGTRVMGAVMSGAFAELVVAPAAALRPVPGGLDDAGAAAFWVAYSTAYHALVTIGGGGSGDVVAVLGAAGGVGLACVDVAVRLGMRVVAAASSPERLELCRQRGAEAGVDYTREDLKARLRELTGGGPSVVVDPVGGAYAEAALRSVRFGGRYVVVGFASGEIPRIPLNLLLLKGAVLRGLDVRTLPDHLPAAPAAAEAALAELVAGGLAPYVSRSYPLEEVAQALTDVAERRVTGKVVLTTGTSS